MYLPWHSIKVGTQRFRLSSNCSARYFTVTGINVHIITPLVCIVCIFYTTVGGLKAVVWTDVIQTVIMVGVVFFVVVKGTIDVGGLGVVIQRNLESGRLEWPE